MSITVLVAEDQLVIREGLAELFEDEDIEIVEEAVTGQDAIKKVLKVKPDVLLMDVMMPDTDGLDALEKIRDESPQTRVLMMSAHDNPTYVARSVALSADGFILKTAKAEDLVEAVKRAARGEPSTDARLNKIKELLATRLDPTADEVPLTKREYQVLRHLAFGLSNREI
ncbi:MAG: response regulator transcription factor, partial [Planctomycetes bacterium]|nr:response regulator transcription factor [Planctomycetota bacterium]